MNEKKQMEEKLPNIYTSNQSILRRNQIIDEYLLSMEKKSKGINEVSLTSEDDEKDPFSSKAIKFLKPIKKDKNRLILPNFERREKYKSESSSINKKKNKDNIQSYGNNKNSNHHYKTNSNNNLRNKMSKKNKNYSENNIYGNNNGYIRKFVSTNNAKWMPSSDTYSNYIKNAKINDYNKTKNRYKKGNNSKSINNSASNNNEKETKKRSRSHIGNKPSYHLYNNKISSLNNDIHKNNPSKKYISTQVEGYNKTLFLKKDCKRNFTAKILKNNKISIVEYHKQDKKNGHSRVYSTLNTRRIIENKHQIYEKLINERNNPYGLSWINKILAKKNEEKLGFSKGFINGVPVIKILNKCELSKKELKKRLNEIEKKKKEEEEKYNKIVNSKAKVDKNDLDDEYNIPKEILEQFNKNTKNFFKFRKDIIEVQEEDEGPIK